MMNYIYTLIPIALLIFAAVQGSKWNFNAATYMDKKYTNAVKGMMCVVIMYVHISNDYTNTVQNIIGSFAYVGVFTFFAISAFGCRTSVERSQSYLNQFWKKRILALFVPAILINIISFGFKVMTLNVYEVRGLYAFNQIHLCDYCCLFGVLDNLENKSYTSGYKRLASGVDLFTI